jgi:hypothetical protein
MTATSIVYLPDAIVMASDSLMQVCESYQNPKIIGSSLIQKLVLIEHVGTAISGVGDASGVRADSGQKVEHYSIVREFAAQVESQSQEDVAHSLQVFLTANYPGLRTDFQLAGFDGDAPAVFYVERHNGKLPWVVTRVNRDPAGIAGGCSPETIKALALPRNYTNWSLEDAISFVDELFAIECQVASRRPVPDVGPPIDRLVMQPGMYRWLSCKDPVRATLRRQ